jgi:hypothetical protein
MVLFSLFLIWLPFWFWHPASQEIGTDTRPTPALTIIPTPTPIPPFLDGDFEISGVLNETVSSEKSSSPYWWLNSGGRLEAMNGIAFTIGNELLFDDYWRVIYVKSNPLDTDGGIHPQNIFRLITRGKWKNFIQQAYFKVVNDNFSDSYHRNASNGLLLFNRYLDGDNLYYAGLRVDGAAVIKKKYKGKYYTMAYKQIFPEEYVREQNINLLPHDEWLGIKTKLVTNDDQSVNIKLFYEQGEQGEWELILEAVDRDELFGGEPILFPGHGGIRTDFMDVEFDDYRIEKIESIN